MSHVTLASLLTDYGVSDDDEPKSMNVQATVLSEDDLSPNFGFERLPETNTNALEDCIPQVLLVRGDYRTEEVAPKYVFAN